MAIYLGSNPVGFMSYVNNITDVPPGAYMGSTISEFSSNATYVLNSAFYQCYALASINLPNASYIGEYAFRNCYNLTSVDLPNASYIGSYAFQSCSSLTLADLPNANYIGFSAFNSCHNLISLYLTGSILCTLSGSFTFSSTPIGGYSASAGQFGSIYVPASLYSDYLSATDWSYFSSRFVSI